MTEFKVQVDDKVINTFGYSIVENYLHEFVSKLYLKISAQEMLKEIQKIDLENDNNWQIARDLAWKQESYRFSKFLTNAL